MERERETIIGEICLMIQTETVCFCFLLYLSHVYYAEIIRIFQLFANWLFWPPLDNDANVCVSVGMLVAVSACARKREYACCGERLCVSVV